MLRCQQCLREHALGTVFCDVCGTPLAQASDVPSLAIPGEGYVTPALRAPQDATPAMPVRRLATPKIAEPAAPAPPVAEEHPAGTQLRLRMSNGTMFHLHGRETYLIGRRDAPAHHMPDVDLADFNGAACGVSRRHAQIHVTPDGVFIEDLESRNETIHNGYRLMSHQRYPLADGDELRLGTILLLVIID